MKNLLLLTALIFLVSCEKSNNQQQGYFLDVALDFSIINSQEKDLLDPTTPDHLDVSKIKVYYLINGTSREVNDPSHAYPMNFMIFKHEHENRIRIFLNDKENVDSSVTYIQWRPNYIDTIVASFEIVKNKCFRKQNVWYNGNKIWNMYENQGEFCKIIKL